MDAIETKEYKGYTIEIKPDECGESPRTWDNLCEFHCWHKEIKMGDKGFNYNLYEQSEIVRHNATLRQAKRNRDIVLPLYIYQHSGIYLSLTSFHDQALPQGHAHFDSGQVGFVIIRRKKIIEEFIPAQKILTPKAKERAMKVAEGEVKTYTQYLNGDVYGYEITDKDGENVESCWGFYGTEECIKEAKSIVDYCVDQAKKAHEKKLKAQIKHNVPLQLRTALNTFRVYHP